YRSPLVRGRHKAVISRSPRVGRVVASVHRPISAEGWLGGIAPCLDVPCVDGLPPLHGTRSPLARARFDLLAFVRFGLDRRCGCRAGGFRLRLDPDIANSDIAFGGIPL